MTIHNGELLHDYAEEDAVLRFQRLYGKSNISLSPEQSRLYAEEITLGNYADELMIEGSQEDTSMLEELIATRDVHIDTVVDAVSGRLVQSVMALLENTPEEHNVRNAGTLACLTFARNQIGKVLRECDLEGSEDLVSTTLELVTENLSDYITTSGSYVLRRRKIPTKILSEEEVRSEIALMNSADEKSEDWMRHRETIMGSISRLTRFVVYKDLDKKGRIPHLIDTNDVLQEAAEFILHRLNEFDVDGDIKFNTWATSYLAKEMGTRISYLVDVVYVPTANKQTLYTSDEATREENSAVLNASQDYTYEGRLRQSWAMVGSNIIRLESDDAPATHERTPVTSDYETEVIGFEDLLTEWNRIVPVNGRGTQLWSSDGVPSELYDPVLFYERKDAAEILYEVMKQHLTEREYDIVAGYYGLFQHEEQTLEQLGETYNIGRARAHKIKALAMAAMRHPGNYLNTHLINLVSGSSDGHTMPLGNYQVQSRVGHLDYA